MKAHSAGTWTAVTHAVPVDRVWSVYVDFGPSPVRLLSQRSIAANP
jgi:hypothetical protein